MTPSTGPLSDPTLRAMLEAGGVWLWDTDLENEVSGYQDGFWEQYGYTTAQFAETFDFIKMVHHSDLAGLTRAWQAHLEGDTEIYAAEWRLLTASGEWRWIRSRGKVIARNADGKALRIVGAYTDITDMKESQIAVAESSAEMDAIFRSSRDGVALIGPNYRLLRANRRAVELLEKFTGTTVEEGGDVRNTAPIAPDRPVLADLELTLRGATTVPERVVTTPDGTGWLEFSYSPVYHVNGSILGAAVVMRDITEKKRLEQTRLHALRLESMGLLAGGIAHDFNNLLAAIIGNIEVAQMNELDSETAEGLEEARQAARRASELVQELLAFAGKREPIVRMLDISPLAREMVRYARKIPGHRSEVVEELAEGLPLVVADATQFRQVVLNLVVNALDATRKDGGRVTVRTFEIHGPLPATGNLVVEPRVAPSYVALEVSDDGAGMDEETLGHIWDPFFTTKETGHGLGLPSVLGAVRSHHGTLTVDSAPGQGATFTVYLPVGEPAITPA